MEDCLKYPFWFFYGTEQVGYTFQRLFDESTGLMDKFAKMWG